MSVVFMKDGIQKIIDGGGGLVGPIIVRLFQNNFTPTKGDTIAAYVEATFSGYVAGGNNAGPMGGDVWDAALFVWTQQAAQVTFTVGAGGVPNMIYGAYWVDSGGKLLAAERFAGAPINMNTVGFAITYTPTQTAESKFG